MRLTALIALALSAVPASAQQEPIQSTIEQQIEAFQSDDFALAFNFASPNIQSLFGTPENFGSMVQQGYPMVYRPADVQMLDLRDVAGRLYQRVLIRDAEGRGFLLDYQMIETSDGWRINGVEMVLQPEVGA